MGHVFAEIKLTNLYDKLKEEDGVIKDQDIRTTTVTAMVDTGAGTLVINEEIRNKLGLRKTGTEPGKLADGRKADYDMVGPLELQWKQRRVTLDALLIPTADEILLGVIPLEAMDLIVDPNKQELVGVHGDEPLMRV